MKKNLPKPWKLKARSGGAIGVSGKGSRFAKDGFKNPKFKISVRGKTLYEWSMLSLSFFSNFTFIFICFKGHQANSFIEQKNHILNIKNYFIIEIDSFTDGQATTVLKAEKYISNKEPILIYNIDTYVNPNYLNPYDIQGEGWIPSFQAEGVQWSFLQFDNNYQVTNIAEKKRISGYGTIGLYYFVEFELYKICYYEYYSNSFPKYIEKFIAPIYLKMIEKKLDIYTKILPSREVHVLGTPSDIKYFNSLNEL